MTTSKHYSLIVGDRFSLSNETDSHIQSDYFPGIWGITSQTRALKYAKELLAKGDTITVKDYDNPKYHSLSNSFIKELGLSQPLFAELEAPKSDATNDKPKNLAQFKAFIKEGLQIKIVNHTSSGDRERIAEILKVGGSNFTATKSAENRAPSWTEFGKATEWTFHNDCAIKYYIGQDGYIKSTSYFYL